MGLRVAKQKPNKPRPKSPLAGISPKGLPTVEQVRRGGYTVRRVKHNGEGRNETTAVYNRATSPVVECHEKHLISQRMKDAADKLYELVRVTRSTGGIRDCLDMATRGHDNVSEETLAWHADRRRELLHVWSVIPAPMMAVLWSIVIEEHATGPRNMTRKRWKLFCQGLTMLADLWKMPADD